MESKHSFPVARLLMPRHAERRQSIYLKSRPFFNGSGCIVIERRSKHERRSGTPRPCALLQRRPGTMPAAGDGGVTTIALPGREGLAPLLHILAKMASWFGIGRA